MANSPSHRWEDGVLVERGISTEPAGEADPDEDLTQRPYKEPDRSTMADRMKARTKATAKAVASDDTEDKSVRSRSTAKK